MWPGGYVQGALQESGIVDASPLKETMGRILAAKPPKKMLAVGVSNSDTGEYLVFDENTEDVTTAVVASASIPGIFSSQHMNGATLNDGGFIFDLNLITPVERCRQLGA